MKKRERKTGTEKKKKRYKETKKERDRGKERDLEITVYMKKTCSQIVL